MCVCARARVSHLINILLTTSLPAVTAGWEEELESPPPLLALGTVTCSMSHLHALLDFSVFLPAQARDTAGQHASMRPDELTEQQDILVKPRTGVWAGWVCLGVGDLNRELRRAPSTAQNVLTPSGRHLSREGGPDVKFSPCFLSPAIQKGRGP